MTTQSAGNAASGKEADIVLAAEALFFKAGYGATSMDRVALEAGVTKQTVYRYFPSKELLFVAVMQRARSMELQPYTFGDAPLADELTNFGQSFLRFHLQPRALGLYRLLVSEGALQKKLATAFVQAGPAMFIAPLGAFLRVRCGVTLDAEFAARMFCSMLLAPRNALLTGGRNLTAAAREDHVRQVVALLLPGLQGAVV